MMSDGHTDSRRSQTTLTEKPAPPVKQNNYQRIITQQQEIVNEMFYLRHEWEDNKRDLFDLNELIGRLAQKIEEWVGVAEEK